MQTSASPSHAERRVSHVPKLAYRNADPNEPLPTPPCKASNLVAQQPSMTSTDWSTSVVDSNHSKAPSSHSRGLTITTTSRPPSRLRNTTSTPQTSKKKNSLLGALFAKEQTSVALEQVAAQLLAQHGELSPRAIPGVSSAKMPDYVPRVNSKWDGVPEAVKQREKQEKERHRASKRYSVSSTTRPRSANGAYDIHGMDTNDARYSRTRRNSHSTLSSFDSRGGTTERSGSQRNGTMKTTLSTRDSTNPSEWNTDLAAKPISIKSQSLRSPSRSTLPEITSFFPNDVPAPPSIPTIYRQNDRSENIDTSRITPLDALIKHQRAVFETQAPSIHSVPEHTSSSADTPHEGSPVTPLLQNVSQMPPLALYESKSTKAEEVMLVSSGNDVLGRPVSAKKKSQLSSAAFLAGEAHPLELPDEGEDTKVNAMKQSRPTLTAFGRVQQDLEKRPDSSRARLGLRASMIVRTDQVPWDWGEDTSEEAQPSSNTRHSMPVTPKNMIPKGLTRLGK